MEFFQRSREAISDGYFASRFCERTDKKIIREDINFLSPDIFARIEFVVTYDFEFRRNR